jgi:signal transduction histidine kinase
LWVCEGIVRSFGGRIDVESTPDHGTSFTVELPAGVAEAK